MARIKQYKQKYLLEDLTKYIKYQMKANGMNETELASKCGYSQQNINKKFKTNNFSARELIIFFNLFDTPADELAKLFKEGGK